MTDKKIPGDCTSSLYITVPCVHCTEKCEWKVPKLKLINGGKPMLKLDKQKLFDALCDLVLHELSTRETMDKVGWDKLLPVIQFINSERTNRNLPFLDFRLKPEGLVYGWRWWNSGGGCMIWSVDFADGKSAHLSDELLIVSALDTEAYWSIEDCEAQRQTHLLEKYIPVGREINWAYMLCPIFGQEEADLLHKDLVKLIGLI